MDHDDARRMLKWASDRLLSQAVFAVRDDVVERWPRVSELVACA
jgi:hypothetical protein